MVDIPQKYKVVGKSSAGNLIVLGRIMYGAFFTAVPPSRNESDEKKFQYGTTLLIPGDSDVSLLEQSIKETAEANIPAAQRATTKWKNPMLETAETGKTSAYAEDYPWLIRPNSKKFERKTGKERPKPGVVGPTGQPIAEADEPEECYNGRWARLSIQPYWYPPMEGKPGVGLGLVNAQLLWHDDPLAGGKVKATSEFEAVDEADMAALEDFE